MRNSVMLFLDDLKRKVMASDVGQRMAKGTFWVFVGTVSSKLLAMVAGIVLARWILDKEAYGQFGVVKSTINMFMVVGSAGLGLTATKYIAEFKAVNKERIPSIYMLTMAFSLGLALLIGLLAFLFSDILSIEALDTPQLIPALKVAAIALMFFIYNYAQEGALSGFEDFRSKAI
ncbi:MAG: oligosaccharide flippase family protein, partial [Muribaculaceae bacterium]|nr:oligosaccharide flippase family protein [Muribaculaceae bacterium]